MCACSKWYFSLISVTPVFKFPHDTVRQVEISALPTVSTEPVISLDLDPALPEGASQPLFDSTPSTSQQAVTDPGAVKSVSAKTRPKGRAAKRQRHLDQLDTNTAQKYVDMDGDEDCPVSKSCNFPAYLFKAAPSALGIEELRKHGLISKIEKNRAMTRLANKITVLLPTIHSVLKQLDKTDRGTDQHTDHAYQTQGEI